jgi:hypothetical protein
VFRFELQNTVEIGNRAGHPGICESTAAAFVLCHTAFADGSIGQANGGEVVFGHFYAADIHSTSMMLACNQ